jgi:AmmeMemoRadiSam system protein B/AmmeMemoRadiSam system protein A
VFAQDRAASVRPPACAGSWYPGDKAALTREVDTLMEKAPATGVAGKPIAVIAPHAGYRYSAPTAAAGYRCLRGQSYKRVIVMAFSHRFARSYRGIDVPRELTAYETPLGQTPIDREACDALLKQTGFLSQPNAGRDEHSLELQLPFLQRALKDFRLVPLLIGEMSDRDYAQAAAAILPLIDGDTLLVVSTDCTHFGPNYGYEPFKDDPAKRLRELADNAAAPIQNGDYDGFVEHLNKTGDTICGRGPICLLLRILSMQGGAEGVRAAIDMSGSMTNDHANSVTYQSFVFTRRAGRLNEQERTELLRLARQTVKDFLDGKKPIEPPAGKLLEGLRRDGACFVTLENKGDLRGCIGNMASEGPLYQAVIHNATLACQDSRFLGNPVTAKEVGQLHIEISHLTPMERVKEVKEIVIGRHGLLISLGMNRGVLLPQVAYERGWTREEFLAQTCRKAGLPSDAWKQPNAQIDRFEAEVFGEAK